MNKNLLMALVALFTFSFAQAQTEEELKAAKTAKEDSITAIQARVDALQTQIDALPGWKVGAFGTVGGNISSFNNWYSQGNPNVNSGNIGVTINGFANLQQEKFFWRNAANVNLGWVKFDDKDVDTDDDSFQGATDVFNISSLYGRKLNEKWALSGLGEYRSSIIDNFNDPGYLDLGVGATWTPVTDLVVVIHPLNYNFVFSSGESQYESSLGAKILADYTRQIGKINFKSNLSAFMSYEDGDYSNWTWINSFGYTLFSKIGVGFEFGLRGNKQEAFNNILANLADGATAPALGDVDNETQSYWLLGLNYAF